MLTLKEIQSRMTYHAPTPDGVKRHASLSEAFTEVMSIVNKVVPDGRDKSLVFTHLETAKMWASAGVARNPDTR
jgi:hypothetical protein